MANQGHEDGVNSLAHQDKENAMNKIVVAELIKKKDKLSDKQPMKDDGSGEPLIINSVDVMNGVKDSWYRKGNFTVVLGYLGMLDISHPILKKRISNFREYCMSNKFVDKKPTTRAEVRVVLKLVTDVIEYLK